MAEQAFIARAVKATKGSGKNVRYAYSRPDQIFSDIKDREEALLAGKPVVRRRFSRLRQIARRQKEHLKEGVKDVEHE